MAEIRSQSAVEDDGRARYRSLIGLLGQRSVVQSNCSGGCHDVDGGGGLVEELVVYIAPVATAAATSASWRSSRLSGKTYNRSWNSQDAIVGEEMLLRCAKRMPMLKIDRSLQMTEAPYGGFCAW